MLMTANGSNPDLSLEAARPLPPSADIGPEGQSVGLAAQFCLAAIGIVPVRPSSSFARRPQEEGNVGIPKYETGRIDRFGERRVPEPPQEPSSKLKPVEPQRSLQARLEKPLALLRVSRAQPCIVASNRSTRRISRAFEKQIEQKKLKK